MASSSCARHNQFNANNTCNNNISNTEVIKMAEMEEWEYDGAAYAPEEDIDEANENYPDDVLMGVYIPPLESRGDEGISS